MSRPPRKFRSMRADHSFCLVALDAFWGTRPVPVESIVCASGRPAASRIALELGSVTAARCAAVGTFSAARATGASNLQPFVAAEIEHLVFNDAPACNSPELIAPNDAGLAGGVKPIAGIQLIVLEKFPGRAMEI